MTRYDAPRPAQMAPTLFDPPPIAPRPTLHPAQPPATIQEAFENFHSLNPWVADELRRMALDLVRAGHQRIGLKMLFEVLRWRYMRGTTDPGSEFKLNNNYASRYARLLEATTPELEGRFQMRKVRTA